MWTTRNLDGVSHPAQVRAPVLGATLVSVPRGPHDQMIGTALDSRASIFVLFGGKLFVPRENRHIPEIRYVEPEPVDSRKCTYNTLCIMFRAEHFPIGSMGIPAKIIFEDSCPGLSARPASVHRLVLARRPAGFAVHQAIGAQADIQLRLAENAEFLAPAARFGLLALRAQDAPRARFRRHVSSLVRFARRENMTEVTRLQT